jgi:hypothetical protein
LGSFAALIASSSSLFEAARKMIEQLLRMRFSRWHFPFDWNAKYNRTEGLQVTQWAPLWFVLEGSPDRFRLPAADSKHQLDPRNAACHWSRKFLFPRVDWKDIHWKEVLDAPVRNRIVVPVIGPDLLAVESKEGRLLPFPMLLATRLAERLSTEQRRRLPEQPTLHEVAIASQWKGREGEFAADLAEVEEAILAEVLPRVLDQTRPTPLRRLAEISDFALYLTPGAPWFSGVEDTATKAS